MSSAPHGAARGQVERIATMPPRRVKTHRHRQRTLLNQLYKPFVGEVTDGGFYFASAATTAT